MSSLISKDISKPNPYSDLQYLLNRVFTVRYQVSEHVQTCLLTWSIGTWTSAGGNCALSREQRMYFIRFGCIKSTDKSWQEIGERFPLDMCSVWADIPELDLKFYSWQSNLLASIREDLGIAQSLGEDLTDIVISAKLGLSIIYSCYHTTIWRRHSARKIGAKKALLNEVKYLKIEEKSLNWTLSLDLHLH